MAKSMKKTILLPENDGIHYVVAQVPICRRCHRKLKNPEAIERGMGRICWEKSQQSINKPLFRSVSNAKTDTPISK